MYSGENPPEGALFTYFLPAATRTWFKFEVFDAQRRRVRCFDAPATQACSVLPGISRRPRRLRGFGARTWNRGGPGATVLPGRYTVALHAGNATFEQPLEVRPDPRAAWSPEEYLERYRFVTELNDELSQIDTALNRLDSLSRGRPSTSLTNARSAQDDTLRRDAQGVYSTFTSGVVNSEDDLLMPDRLRERLTILQGVIALSQGPPTPAQLREANGIARSSTRQ